MTLDWIKDYHLLLGSNSPRRSQLLTEMDLQFDKVSIDAEETYDDSMEVTAVAEYLAILKSKAYQQELTANQCLITADSVVIVNNKIYGKPKTAEEALQFLMAMSGGHHVVMTGVCLRSQLHNYSFSDTSKVFTAVYSEDEASYYIDQYKPYDKAGAYGIQEWFGHNLIEKIEGSFTNIMGLPTQKLYQALGHFHNMHSHSPR